LGDFGFDDGQNLVAVFSEMNAKVP
jgi:hypothetical protein